VVTLTSKTTPKKKKQATCDDENTRESSNVGMKKVPLQEGTKHP